VKYSNEIKVGITLIVATAIFVFGIRYFQDLPIFGTSSNYSVEFVDASGLISGNAVRINGVTVGAVTGVRFNPETQRARVNFHVNGEIDLFKGTYARVSGFSALGVVKLDVFLGEKGGDIILPGFSIEPATTPTALSEVMDRGPEMLGRLDSVLINLNKTLESTQGLIDDSSPSIQNSLGSVESIVAGLEESFTYDRESISTILSNMESITANMDTLTAGHTDSLSVLFESLNASARRMDQTLQSVELMADNLADVLRKINEGDGTIGLMVNDPAVYMHLDSTLMSMNALLKSFNEDPGRFTKEMKLIDLF
jgi:phospholipid/cholesterol/gamma-HCH transport system substrate-binding protein